MSISILYTRVSSVDQKTDRQRVKENEFDKVIEDKCSGAIPIFERPEGSTLKTLIDRQLIKSISVWQIDRCGRDLRDIINFIHYTTEREIPVNFLSQGSLYRREPMLLGKACPKGVGQSQRTSKNTRNAIIADYA